MKLSIRALDDFPCVSIPSNARDCHYPTLAWQSFAAKIGMQRCAASPRWLNERISLSRYSHVTLFILIYLIFISIFLIYKFCIIVQFRQIPLGNFELDWLIHTADIFFARALHDHQQVVFSLLLYVTLFMHKSNLLSFPYTEKQRASISFIDNSNYSIFYTHNSNMLTNP